MNSYRATHHLEPGMVFHQRAVELVASGTLELKCEDNKHLPSKAITVNDVK